MIALSDFREKASSCEDMKKRSLPPTLVTRHMSLVTVFTIND